MVGGVTSPSGVGFVRRPRNGAGSKACFRLTACEETLKKRFRTTVLDGLTVPAED